MARFEVRWEVPPGFDSFETGSIIAGLGSLALAGEVSVRVVPLRDATADKFILRLRVRDPSTGLDRLVVFEPYDRSDRFDLDCLAGADVYFKQAFARRFLEDLPPGLSSKVRPGGLTFGTRLPGMRRLVARQSLTSSLLLGTSGRPGAWRSALRRIQADALQVWGTLHTMDWQKRPSDHVEPRVVFQTRLWPAHPREDRETVNEFRAQLVRSLRAAFGDGDLIGLLPNTVAQRLAPDAILTRKVSRKEYARQLRTSRISVNSHGLSGSAGFKLAESLAAGAAIVSQPLTFELPEPLLPDVNFLPFETAQECVEQCRRLLDDTGLATRIAERNFEYYTRNIQPESFVRKLLARATSEDAGPGRAPPG